MSLNKVNTFIKGLYVIEPKVYYDNRGHFFESFNFQNLIKIIGYQINFVQDNQSSSEYGTIRGLHYQVGSFQQAKLIRVIKGKIFDVAVDLRPKSDTFKKWYGLELSEFNFKQLLIPRGFAHGFLCMSDKCEILYKVDNYYSKENEKGINYKNKELNIEWPLTSKINISEKDDSYDINENIFPFNPI